jgi:uncharacterized membrane protein YphA (DoxX/SURF4 family)
MYILAVLGQVLFGLYWFYNGINHFLNFEALAQYSEAKRVPMPKASVAISGVFLIVGGVGILFGIYKWFAILALVIFLIMVSFSIHNFWQIADPQKRVSEKNNFLKNMALLAALLMLWLLPLPY